MSQAKPQQPPSILVIEDNDLIAMTVLALIEDLGWRPVGPLVTVEEALAAAAGPAIAAAVIDVNLQGEHAWDVARLLQSRAIPFLLTTGYGDDTDRPADLAGAPVLGKPYAIGALEAWLRAAIRPDL